MGIGPVCNKLYTSFKDEVILHSPYKNPQSVHEAFKNENVHRKPQTPGN